MEATLTLTSGVVITQGFPMTYAARMWVWLNFPRDPNFDDGGPKGYVEFTDLLRQRLRDDLTWAVISGDDEGKVVGYIGFNLEKNKFRGIVLDPEFRNRKVGHKALTMVLAELRQRGVIQKTAVFFADNRAIAGLFKSVGWKLKETIKAGTMRNGQPLDLSVWVGV